jgi:hypothetical protein
LVAGSAADALPLHFPGVAALEVTCAPGRYRRGDQLDSVQIAGEDRDDVRVQIVGGTVALRTVVRGGRLTLTVAPPAGGLLARFTGRPGAARPRLRIQVPRQLTVAVTTGTASIVVLGAGNQLMLTSIAAGITARDLTADTVHARSVSGDVTVHCETAPQQVDASSGTGSVRVIVPDGPYALDAGSDAGTVVVEVPSVTSAARRVRARTGSGKVRVSPTRSAQPI